MIRPGWARWPALFRRDVPIFINSYNRLACLERLTAWLRAHGHRRIHIIDNASTYPPLLAWYRAIERRGVQVIRLDENVGSRALWKRDILERAGIDGEYVYTDSDVIPAPFCPDDAIAHLRAVLAAHPQVKKVGLGLRLDNLPAHYRHRDIVHRWEQQFWRWPAARGLMFAGVDTSFALYRPGAGHAQEDTNLRTTYPYLAEHLGWYVDSDHPSEEDRFYIETARAGETSWNGRTLRQDVLDWLAGMGSPRLLHLGADRWPGWETPPTRRC